MDGNDATMTDSLEMAAGRWDNLATAILDGYQLSTDEALSILESPDDEILALMAAAFRVRRRHFGRSVQLYFLMNAKSGLCAEDCGYCSQSKLSSAEIPKYNLLSEDKILEGARIAAERQSKTYCIVISGRSPTEREINAITTIIPKVKEKHDLKICACLGLLSESQARELAACGVDRVNHNLNTSEDHYDEICSTHTYKDRVATLEAVRESGMEICSGGIIGMREEPVQVVRMAEQLRDLGVHSIPVNFLNPIDGTPLAGTDELSPRYCLKALAMFRMVNPDREIRIAGGREMHLGSLQPLALYAANSIFVGDYLTTQGQAPEEDYRMIEEMGFEITRGEETAVGASR